MIEKLKHVTLTGPIAHMDRVIEDYLARYEIHFEYAYHKLSDIDRIGAFDSDNPYGAAAGQAAFFMDLLRNTADVYFPLTGKAAQKALAQAQERYGSRTQHFKNLEMRRDTITAYLETLRPFKGLDGELRALSKFSLFHGRFGRMPLRNFLQFEVFLEADNIIFVEALRDKEYVWGGYFTPQPNSAEADTLFSGFNFEAAALSATCLGEEIYGNIAEVYAHWERILAEIQVEIHKQGLEAVVRFLPGEKTELLAACHKVRALHSLFDIKQYAAKTEKNFYIFMGWMTPAEAAALERETREDALTIFSYSQEAPLAATAATAQPAAMPPTKLKNPPVVRWFEFFVQLHGTPLYNEIDPTPILALMYALLFGLMFGDVGHGLSIALLGYILVKRFNLPLGGIMITAGFSATVAGFLYGSIFGLEDIIPALWRRPFGDITGTLQFAVALGAGIIVLMMLLNMANAFKQKDWSRFLVSPNGLTGLIFYGGALAVVLSVLMGFSIPFWVYAALVISLAALAYKASFTIFEVLLTYFTNTLSFVRVGAFALSHAGMMHIVLTLSQNTAGQRNFAVLVIGNLLVIAIEGLLVGIQSLRLGFYEIFSRFYTGGGQAFKPYAYQK